MHENRVNNNKYVDWWCILTSQQYVSHIYQPESVYLKYNFGAAYALTSVSVSVSANYNLMIGN